jgi:hypothetical protein
MTTMKVYLNDDVAGIALSFIPVGERMSMLREKYTNEFLMEGLMKKNIKQLDVLLKNIIHKICFGDLRNIRTYFNTTGIDLDPIKKSGRIRYANATMKKWTKISGNKCDKIKQIMNIVKRTIDIVSYKRIECFDLINHNRGIELIGKNLKKKTNGHNISGILLKMFCLIVSIVKQPKVKVTRKKTELKPTNV